MFLYTDNHPPIIDEDSILVCPSCNDTYLHQERIEVFDRSEDAQDGLHIVVDQMEVKIDPSLTRNPSPRRHGLTVYFLCEHCQETTIKLDIYQHKGRTFLNCTAVPILETPVVGWLA